MGILYIDSGDLKKAILLVRDLFKIQTITIIHKAAELKI